MNHLKYVLFGFAVLVISNITSTSSFAQDAGDTESFGIEEI